MRKQTELMTLVMATRTEVRKSQLACLINAKERATEPNSDQIKQIKH